MLKVIASYRLAKFAALMASRNEQCPAKVDTRIVNVVRRVYFKTSIARSNLF